MDTCTYISEVVKKLLLVVLFLDLPSVGETHSRGSDFGFRGGVPVNADPSTQAYTQQVIFVKSKLQANTK